MLCAYAQQPAMTPSIPKQARILLNLFNSWSADVYNGKRSSVQQPNLSDEVLSEPNRIDSLPTELLSKIFHEACINEYLSLSSPCTTHSNVCSASLQLSVTAVFLSQVNRRWRALARDSPSLWCHIAISSSSSSNPWSYAFDIRACKAVAHYSSLSDGRDLYVSIRGGGVQSYGFEFYPDQLSTSLSPLFGRIAELNLDTSLWMLQRLQGSYPRLKSLSFSTSSLVGEVHLDGIIKISEPLDMLSLGKAAIASVSTYHSMPPSILRLSRPTFGQVVELIRGGVGCSSLQVDELVEHSSRNQWSSSAARMCIPGEVGLISNASIQALDISFSKSLSASIQDLFFNSFVLPSLSSITLRFAEKIHVPFDLPLESIKTLANQSACDLGAVKISSHDLGNITTVTIL